MAQDTMAPDTRARSTIAPEAPVALPPAAQAAKAPVAAPTAGTRGLATTVGLYLLGIALLAAPLALLYGDRYWANILAFTYLFAGLAAAWNIIGGFGGQFSLAHGVFFGIGAYVTAIGAVRYGLSPWVSLLPAAALGALVAVLISWPTFRLRGPFFAIATMAMNEVAFVVANNWESVTGGPRGVSVPFRAGWENLIFREPWKYALVNLVFMALTIGITVVMMRRRTGFYLLALREDEDAARAAGISALGYKLRAMALSAALTTIGGGLFAMFTRVIDPPTLFSLQDIGVKFALLTLIGGIGTIWGPAVGAFLIVPIENFLRATLTGVFPGADRVVLGVLMVLVALFLRAGVVGTALNLWKRRRRGA